MDFDLPTGLAVLVRTPGTLRSLLYGLPRAWLDGNEGPDTWSPLVVLGHLVYADRVNWVPRAQVILAQDGTRSFTPFDRFAQLRESAGKSVEELLDEFAMLRVGNIATVADWRLEPAQLDLEGTHPEFGTVTLGQLLSTWVAHDLLHLSQITRVMAKQYREAVGPWRKYLRVMDA